MARFDNPTSFLSEIGTLINTRNGNELARCISCRDPHVYYPRLADPEPENVVMKYLPAPWDEMFSAHLRCIWAMRKQDFEETYACQVVVAKLAKLLTEMKEENWMLPLVLASAIDLRRFAHGLDARTPSKGHGANRNQEKQMESAAQLILRLFQICASDSRTQLEDSKKLGMMGLANQLFKIYFQINKLNLCKSMIRAIENMNIFDRFSLAQRVTYCYYVGRKATFGGDFTAADKSLTFAFDQCLAGAWHNKRLILIYLIPVKMLLGIFPCSTLLSKYDLAQFLGISEAVKSELLKTHLLPLDVFTAALRIMGVDDVDQDETECILANLIYEGKIKGYLAHQQQKLVVSKMQAFPPLASIPASR